MNAEYAIKYIKCNCGHLAKEHFYKVGYCTKCGCTWYWPNDRWMIKQKEKIEDINYNRIEE